MAEQSNLNWQQWNAANFQKYASTQNRLSEADHLLQELDRLCVETDEITDKTLKDVNKKIEQRVDDIDYWKSELDRSLKVTKTEIENLLLHKNRLEKALAACREPFQINQQCLEFRKNRLGEDLVFDDVQKELLLEQSGLQSAMELIRRTLDQTNEQIRLCRSARYHVEKDLADKHQAHTIDSHCASLRPTSASVMQAGDSRLQIAPENPRATDPLTWEELCKINVAKAEKENNSALNLRLLVDSILRQTASDMLNQSESVNTAFRQRIDETKDAKSKLEDHLSQAKARLSDIEFSIGKLEKAIEDKEGPLRLAETRSAKRTFRPNVELCHDLVEAKLIAEQKQLQLSMLALMEKREEALATQKKLQSTILNLERDIQVKANTIYIDEVQCMKLRAGINIQNY